MNTTILKKVPWKVVLKVAGVAALGTASVIGAIETDTKTQKLIKKVAPKLLKLTGEES